MCLTRRELCLLFPSVLLRVQGAPSVSEQQASLPSAMYPFSKLAVHTSSTAATRAVLKGKLVTGESPEAPETTLPPGGSPHPPHRHAHSEMWLMRAATADVTRNTDTTRLGPGPLGPGSCNDEHGCTN